MSQWLYAGSGTYLGGRAGGSGENGGGLQSGSVHLVHTPASGEDCKPQILKGCGMDEQSVGGGAVHGHTTRDYGKRATGAGMWSFLPWSTYGALRKYGNTGCIFCDGSEAEGLGMWTVTHLLKSCTHDELAGMRKCMWQEVVRVAMVTGLAGAYMVQHAEDYNDPTMQSHMFALMVGEEVPNSFIDLGLEGWRASRVARRCGASGSGGKLESGTGVGTVEATTVVRCDSEAARCSRGSDCGIPANDSGIVRCEAARCLEVESGSGCTREARHAPMTRHLPGPVNAAVRASTYQRLMNITGAVLVHAQEYVVQCVQVLIDSDEQTASDHS